MKKKSKWYLTVTESGIIIFLLLVSFLPLGLFLVWKNSKWSASLGER